MALKGQVVLKEEECFIDSSLNIILTNNMPETIDLSDKIVTIGGNTFELDTTVTNFDYGNGYKLNIGDNSYRLYFTQLPIIKMSAPGDADLSRDDYKDGNLQLINGDSTSDMINMTIKIHGATSSTYPKKSYTVKLVDQDGEDLDDSFLGMREDNKWLLLAMWNETLRINNR